jgi:hypothetical protein
LKPSSIISRQDEQDEQDASDGWKSQLDGFSMMQKEKIDSRDVTSRRITVLLGFPS